MRYRTLLLSAAATAAAATPCLAQTATSPAPDGRLGSVTAAQRFGQPFASTSLGGTGSSPLGGLGGEPATSRYEPAPPPRPAAASSGFVRREQRSSFQALVRAFARRSVVARDAGPE